MRILLQQKETGLYFKDIEDWTRDATEAMDFLSSTAAIDFCVANRVNKVHIVLKFPEEIHEIVMPVLKTGHSVGSRGETPRNAA